MLLAEPTGGSPCDPGPCPSGLVCSPATHTCETTARASFSYEVWVNVTASVGTFDIPLWKGGSSLPDVGYDMELGTSAWNAGISDGTVVDEATYGQETVLLGGWHQLTAVVDRTAGRFHSYVDAVEVSSVPISGVLSLSNSLPLQLGNVTDGVDHRRPRQPHRSCRIDLDRAAREPLTRRISALRGPAA